MRQVHVLVGMMLLMVLFAASLVAAQFRGGMGGGMGGMGGNARGAPRGMPRVMGGDPLPGGHGKRGAKPTMFGGGQMPNNMGGGMPPGGAGGGMPGMGLGGMPGGMGGMPGGMAGGMPGMGGMGGGMGAGEIPDIASMGGFPGGAGGAGMGADMPGMPFMAGAGAGPSDTPYGREYPQGPGPNAAPGQDRSGAYGSGPRMGKEDILKFRARDGEFKPNDMFQKFGGKPPRQEQNRPADEPAKTARPGEDGWRRTARHTEENGEADDDLGNAPPLDDGFDKYKKSTEQMPDFEDLRMDRRFTGLRDNPSKARKERKKAGKTVVDPKTAGKAKIRPDGRQEMELDVDTCFRMIIKICPLAVMTENFAGFAQCAADNSIGVTGPCEGWAEQHGDCAADMIKHCPKLPPSDTTHCLLDKSKHGRISDRCRNSDFFESLIEGYEHMDTRLKKNNVYSSYQKMSEEEAEAMKRENAKQDAEIKGPRPADEL